MKRTRLRRMWFSPFNRKLSLTWVHIHSKIILCIFLSKFLTTYILKTMHKRNMYQITSKLFSVNTSAILFIQSVMKFISFSHFSKTNGFPCHFHIFVLFCFVFWSHSSYQFSVNCKFSAHFHFLCCFSLTFTWFFSILLLRGTLEWKW